MTYIGCRYNKIKRQIIWTLSDKTDSYNVTLQLDHRGRFEYFTVPTIKSGRTARSLSLVMDEVNYVLDFGIKKFLEEFDYE